MSQASNVAKTSSDADQAATRPNATDGGSARRRVWIRNREAVEVPCSIEIERSGETLHAHVSLEGVEVDCGDEVMVHAAPTSIGFGDRIVTTSRATVIRATPFQRWLTRMKSYLALTELYEVGFQPKSEIQFTPASAEPPRPTATACPTSTSVPTGPSSLSAKE